MCKPFLALLLWSCLATPVSSQTEAPATGVTTTRAQSEAAPNGAEKLLPFGECRTGYWSSSRNLDDDKPLISSNCLLNWKAQANEHLRFGLNARLLHGANADRSQYSGRIREGYLLAEIGPVTLRLGRQIVVWGRSDRISPTDVLSSRDVTARVYDSDEQRNGNDMAALRFQMSRDTSVTATVARFEPNRLPTGSLPLNRTALSTKLRPEYSLKVDRSGSGLDWSVSYFDGFDKTPRYRFLPKAPSGLFESSHERMRMVGADFATSSGRWTFRGEAAVFRMTADCDGCTTEPRQIQRAVLGVDRDLLDSANLNLQVFGVRRSGYSDPQAAAPAQQAVVAGLNRLNSEFGAIERGATLRLSDRFMNDTLKIEVSGIVDLTQSSRLLQMRASYSVNDRFKINAGVDRFQGREQSFFGARAKNNLGFLEVAWIF
jgi:hypothetical protein